MYIYLLFILYKMMPIKRVRKKIKQKYRWAKIIPDQQKVARYLQRKYIQKDIQHFDIPVQQDLQHKKIIWQYWGQGIDKNTPHIVRACMASVHQHRGEYEVIVLTNDTIADYIDLPDFIYDKLYNNRHFTYTFFSDILRVCLLSAYGGVWCDATLYLSDKIPNTLLDKDFFMFQRGEKPADYKYWHKFNPEYFSWDKDFKVRLLNSFIVAKPHNEVMEKLVQILCNYWKNEKNFKHYFLFQILFHEIIDGYDNCEIMDDIYPTLLSAHIHTPYSDDLWHKITHKNNIHKLTYYPNCYQDSILHHIFTQYAIPMACPMACKRKTLRVLSHHGHTDVALLMLGKLYTIQWVNDNPDIAFYDITSNDMYKYDCIRVLVGGEHFIPRLPFTDIMISNFDHHDILWHLLFVGDDLFNFLDGKNPDFVSRYPHQKRHFCIFMYGNKYAGVRNRLYKKMQKQFYNTVHSWGRQYRNISTLKTEKGTITADMDMHHIIEQYRFSLCIENNKDYYSFSEKAFMALRAGAIPIYWGGDNIYNYIKAEAFINVKDFDSFEQAMAYIAQVDKDPELYQSYILDNPFVDSPYIRRQSMENIGVQLRNLMETQDFKKPFWVKGIMGKIVLYICLRLYKKYWNLKSLKRRFLQFY